MIDLIDSDPPPRMPDCSALMAACWGSVAIKTWHGEAIERWAIVAMRDVLLPLREELEMLQLLDEAAPAFNWENEFALIWDCLALNASLGAEVAWGNISDVIARRCDLVAGGTYALSLCHHLDALVDHEMLMPVEAAAHAGHMARTLGRWTETLRVQGAQWADEFMRFDDEFAQAARRLSAEYGDWIGSAFDGS